MAVESVINLMVYKASTSGLSKTAVLQVNCALGNVPREHSVDGIQLSFDRNSGGFSEGVGGHVMFL
jgi:hypothetical protein